MCGSGVNCISSVLVHTEVWMYDIWTLNGLLWIHVRQCMVVVKPWLVSYRCSKRAYGVGAVNGKAKHTHTHARTHTCKLGNAGLTARVWLHTQSIWSDACIRNDQMVTRWLVYTPNTHTFWMMSHDEIKICEVRANITHKYAHTHLFLVWWRIWGHVFPHILGTHSHNCLAVHQATYILYPVDGCCLEPVFPYILKLH